jgi:hypothetical protein
MQNLLVMEPPTPGLSRLKVLAMVLGIHTLKWLRLNFFFGSKALPDSKIIIGSAKRP